MASPGLEMRVNSPELTRFYKNIKTVDKTVAKELRAGLKKVTKPIVEEVKREARALPGKPTTAEDLRYMKKMGGAGLGLRSGLATATEAQTRYLPNGIFIRIRVSGTKFAAATGKYKKLPRYVEGYGRRKWRHPVFADKGAVKGTWTGAWVEQKPMPFLFETVMRHKNDARNAILKAFDDAIKEYGFK